MPIDDLRFFSLEEWEEKQDNLGKNKIFMTANGAGDYLGAAITFPISIAGSLLLLY